MVEPRDMFLKFTYTFSTLLKKYKKKSTKNAKNSLSPHYHPWAMGKGLLLARDHLQEYRRLAKPLVKIVRMFRIRMHRALTGVECLRCSVQFMVCSV